MVCLSFDLSLRGAGVSTLVIGLLVNLFVTPQLLESWEQETVRDQLPRRLQDKSYDNRVRQCLRTDCSQQGYTWDQAVAACAEVGAAVCTLDEFNGAPLFGVLSSCESDTSTYQQMSEAQAFVNSEGDNSCANDERSVVRNACMDWDNDCCVGFADDDHHDHDDDGANDHHGEVEQAACAAGYEVRQLQGGGSCDDPEMRSPTFECVPTGTAASNCVSATAQVSSVVCCAADACMEGRKRDTDCCTMRGDGGCLDGYTYVQSDLAGDMSSYGCPLHSRESGLDLVGTICLKNGTSPPQDVDYINFAHPNWICEGRDDPKDGRLGLFVSLLFQLVFGGAGILIGAIVCCICRNKSQNTAPFNGEAVQSFPQAAKAQAAQMQVVQMQCPEGASPGQTVQTNVNGQMLNVQIPAGVAAGTMFQVQVPIMPQAPGGPVLNPLTAPEVSAFDDSTLAMAGGLHINQVVDVAEMVTGCEAKNRYTCHTWAPGTDSEGSQIMFIREESDGCERVCCKQQRHLALYIHEGHDKTGNVIMQVHKSFGLTNLCCCRPEVMVFDGLGKKIGNVEDPFHCCTMDQRIFGPDGEQIYGAAGSVCQQGIWCPCCAPVEFQLTDTNGQPNDGYIQKLFGGCAEVMAKVNKFRVGETAVSA